MEPVNARPRWWPCWCRNWFLAREDSKKFEFFEIHTCLGAVAQVPFHIKEGTWIPLDAEYTRYHVIKHENCG